ncbi:MAG TPA: sigma-70 family RNA polymerase sigma factor [Vicinamibacteria bacterium]|nr:sigma-70 family RNA polymerase sigma factor [Vicinamibacteria bacterium]
MEARGTVLTDSELADRCARGEEAAWKALVQRFQRKIWHIAFQFTGRSDEAEELTQEIFLHLLSALKSFDSSGSLPGWIQRVARNYAIDHYRRRRRERDLVRDGEEAEAILLSAGDQSGRTDPYRALESRDLSRWLRTMLDRLPNELSQAVILRDLQGMSYEEMSEALAIPLGTVKSRINRGRIELARTLQRRRGEWSSSLGRSGEDL